MQCVSILFWGKYKCNAAWLYTCTLQALQTHSGLVLVVENTGLYGNGEGRGLTQALLWLNTLWWSMQKGKSGSCVPRWLWKVHDNITNRTQNKSSWGRQRSIKEQLQLKYKIHAQNQKWGQVSFSFWIQGLKTGMSKIQTSLNNGKC